MNTGNGGNEETIDEMLLQSTHERHLIQMVSSF